MRRQSRQGARAATAYGLAGAIALLICITIVALLDGSVTRMDFLAAAGTTIVIAAILFSWAAQRYGRVRLWVGLGIVVLAWWVTLGIFLLPRLP